MSKSTTVDPLSLKMTETAAVLLKALPPYQMNELSLNKTTIGLVRWMLSPTKRRVVMLSLIFINLGFSVFEGCSLGNRPYYLIGYYGETLSSSLTTSLLVVALSICRTFTTKLRNAYVIARQRTSTSALLVLKASNTDDTVKSFKASSESEARFLVRVDNINSSLKGLLSNISICIIAKMFGLFTATLQFDHSWVRLTMSSIFFIVAPTFSLLHSISLTAKLAKNQGLPGFTDLSR